MSSDKRGARRTGVHQLESVIVYRDRQDLAPADMARTLADKSGIYTLYSVVAVVRDASPSGLRLDIEGQGIMAGNLLEEGQRCVIQLPIGAQLPESPTLRERVVREKSDGNRTVRGYALLVKAECRWHERDGEHASAGFALAPENGDEVINVVRDRFSPEEQ
ncbi:MAG: hypothetical protein KC503_18020 [Myxococcales bacterium]|nr:hypothetical protein [Myxococcales bacterium]